MQKSPNCCNINAEQLSVELVLAIEKKLNEGYLVELFKLRDGKIIARSVKKKEISVRDAR